MHDSLYSPPQILRLGLSAPRLRGAGQAGQQFKGGTALFYDSVISRLSRV